VANRTSVCFFKTQSPATIQKWQTTTLSPQVLVYQHRALNKVSWVTWQRLNDCRFQKFRSGVCLHTKCSPEQYPECEGIRVSKEGKTPEGPFFHQNTWAWFTSWRLKRSCATGEQAVPVSKQCSLLLRTILLKIRLKWINALHFKEHRQREIFHEISCDTCGPLDPCFENTLIAQL